MAFIDQDKKKKIADAIKALKLPKAWKTSLSIRHHSALRISITRAPASVLDDYIPSQSQLEHEPNFLPTVNNIYVNEFHLDSYWRGQTLKVLERIMGAVKTAGEWFDQSDSMTDYFHTAFYIEIEFGTTSRECELVGSASRFLPATFLQEDRAIIEIPPSNIVPLFVQENREPTHSEKAEIARAEMIRRIKVEFAATPVGATLNEYSLAVLAEAALKVVTD